MSKNIIRILIIEDTPKDYELYKKMLEQAEEPTYEIAWEKPYFYLMIRTQ